MSRKLLYLIKQSKIFRIKLHNKQNYLIVLTDDLGKGIMTIAWKVSKYEVFPGPYFPVFGLNTEVYSVNLRIQYENRKYGPEKTPYLDTFHIVPHLLSKLTNPKTSSESYWFILNVKQRKKALLHFFVRINLSQISKKRLNHSTKFLNVNLQ